MELALSRSSEGKQAENCPGTSLSGSKLHVKIRPCL